MNKTQNAHERKRKTASRRKKELALALAVSLWMAGSGVASAAGILYLDASNNDEIWRSNSTLPSNPIKDGKTLTVTGGTWTDWSIYGGSYSSFSENLMKDYTLNLNGIESEKASDQAQGARTGSGNGASGNRLNMTSSVFKGYVYGAYVYGSNSGNVTNNHVTIKGSTVGSTVGSDKSMVVGGYASSGNAGGTGTNEGNSVTIENSTINATIYGGQSDTNAIGNSVKISGTTNAPTEVTGSITGGYVHSGNGSATGNSVTIDGGENKHLVISGSVVGGEVYGTTSKAVATGNSVTIRNATVSGIVYGGYGGVTTGNTVTLNGATVTGGVQGGYGGGIYPRQDDVKGNTLKLSGVNVTGDVEKFETITLLDTVEWTPKLDKNTDNTPTLTASKIFGYQPQNGIHHINLDVSALAQKWTTPGTMVLIKKTDTYKNLPSYIYLNGDTSKVANSVGVTVYESAQLESESGGVTLGYKNTHTVTKESPNIEYTIQNVVNTVTFGTIPWVNGGTARTVDWKDFYLHNDTNGSRWPTANLDTSNLAFSCDVSALPTSGSMTLLAYNSFFSTSPNSITGTYPMGCTDPTGVRFIAAAGGTVSITDNKQKLSFALNSVKLSSIDLAKWNGKDAAEVPDSAKWPAKDSGVTVLTDGMTATKDLPPGETRTILTATANYFANATISGEHQWTEGGALDTTPVNGVALAGASTAGGVKADDADKSTLIYRQPKRTVTGVTLGEMNWGESRDGSSASYIYTGATVNADGLAFANPETITAGSTTLLEANDTLADFSAQTKNLSYENYSPVPGVTLNGQILGSYAAKDGKITYSATANNATKLTFGDVEWKDSGALLDHTATLTNVSFDGADVDTTNINFTNLRELKDNEKMTLVSSFGNKVGAITGTKYKVGSTLEGEGKASLVGSDLIFTTEPISKAQEQTHNTVMGATVSMAALSAGNDFVGAATEGLSLASNVGADGVSSFAQMGGGSMRQETGSHVDTHTWNAILALGHQNKKERGTFEYGAFFEYGSGNYSTFNGDERGDGSMHYTGGGLLAKWTANHGMYVEGSLRAGSVHDDARNVLRDDKGVPYSYETNAPYMGFHLGVGKEIAVAGGNTVDVYGKYFYNRRNSVSFDAGGHYDLDAVTSQIIRIGARYTIKRDKWDFYAGAAYEHELDGKANGTADGVAIRGADTSGGSFRGELGATMKPSENSPWSLDLNVAGFAGKKQGVTGGVSVSFTF